MHNADNVTHSFQVIHIQLLGADVYRVCLKCSDGFMPTYYAGQYLEILLSGDESYAFSIASAPQQQQKMLELHIKQSPDKESSHKLFSQLKSGAVNIRMPKGYCYIDTLSDRPLLLIAAGTGFAQMKSIIEYCLEQQNNDIHLYWGTRRPDDFYLPNLPIQWSEKKLTYHPVISNTDYENDWRGRFGLLYEAVIADKEKLIEAEIYVSGSPNMVYTTIDAMIEQGFPESQIHSDVFEYAPR